MNFLRNLFRKRTHGSSSGGAPQGAGTVITAISSADQRHSAQLITDHRKVFVVVDGIKGKEYDGISPESLCFSPDGNRISYRAKRLEKGVVKRLVVVDGKELSGYEGSITEDLVFSPNSSHLAYHAIGGVGVEFVVLDGKKGRHYDVVSTPVFSPDGEHLAYVASKNACARYLIVFDGKESSEYEEIPWRHIEFSGPMSLTASISRGGRPARVRLELRGPQLVESVLA